MVATLKTDPTRWREDLLKLPREAAVQALCLPTSQRRTGMQTRDVAQRPGHRGRRGPRVCGPPRRRQKQSKAAARRPAGDCLARYHALDRDRRAGSRPTADGCLAHNRSVSHTAGAADPGSEFVWAGKIQTALAAFMKWQRCALTEKMVHGEPGPWTAHSATLYLLLKNWKEGAPSEQYRRGRSVWQGSTRRTQDE